MVRGSSPEIPAAAWLAVVLVAVAAVLAIALRSRSAKRR